MSTRIVVVSDLHLSEERPYFQFNWEIFLDHVAARAPDLVLAAGDLALNAPLVSDDLAFVRRQLDRLPCPWLAVPGNHDVGNNPPPRSVVDTRCEVTVSSAAVRRFREQIGPDYWVETLPGWRIVGLNGHLCGSGLVEEQEQAGFLARVMEEATGGRTALLFHKPLFNDAIDESAVHQSFWYPDDRALVAPHLAAGAVDLVVSGHIHESRDEEHGGVRHLWTPPLAFVTDMVGDWRPDFRGRRRVGWLQVDLGNRVHVTVEEPDALLNIDITGWMRSGSIRNYETFTAERPFLGHPPDAPSHPISIGHARRHA